jgi:phenylacetate 2-hydroxylase
MLQELPNFDTAMGSLLLEVTGLPWTWLALIIPALVLLYQVGYRLLQIRHSCQYFPILEAISYDIPKINGLFEIPRPLPIVGDLLRLRDDHAAVCERLWRKHGHPTFQIRLGDTRAAVFNSFEDARRILVTNQSSVIDRPTLYTFHGIISSTKGFTIGRSPWDESTKNRRTAAGAVLAKPAIQRYSEMFDLETFSLVADPYRDSQRGTLEIST